MTTKYLHYAKKNGAQIAVVNPYREPGLERYWIPSIAAERARRHRARRPLVRRRTPAATSRSSSACCARSIELRRRRRGVRSRAHGRLRRGARAGAGGRLGATSSARAARRASGIEAFARLLIERPNAVFVWSMGLTQHAHGVDTIKALVNVGLARGLPGRPNRGLVPIRGHSGVQGGAEVGCVPQVDRGDAPRAGPRSGASRSRAAAAGRRPR